MNFKSIPIEITLFIIGQTLIAGWALVTMYFDVKSIKSRLSATEKENKELRAQLKELSDTLLIVKNNTDLLVLGKLKTGQK